MVDMDFFKEVNDVHGHPAGDRLLQRVAERLSRVVRKSDVLVRWGGEEFLIMSRSTDPPARQLSAKGFCRSLHRKLSILDTVSAYERLAPWDGLPFLGAAPPTMRSAPRKLLSLRIPRSIVQKPEGETKALEFYPAMAPWLHQGDYSARPAK